MTHLNQELELLDFHKSQPRKLAAESAETMTQMEALMDEATGLPRNIPQETAVIHVVDDDEGFATGICRLLKVTGYTARHYANAGDFLMAQIPDAPGCILLDLCLPGPSGLDLQCALAEKAVPLPVIFLTGHGDIPASVRAMKSGAMDFLTKPVGRETLLRAVNSAIARSRDNRLLRDRLREQQARYERLTKRELEVFERVVAGKMNKEIAGELGAAERTVKAHRAQVMQKMQVSSVAELVHIADQLQSNGSVAMAAACAKVDSLPRVDQIALR